VKLGYYRIKITEIEKLLNGYITWLGGKVRKK
jgi:hypothetical protein